MGPKRKLKLGMGTAGMRALRTAETHVRLHAKWSIKIFRSKLQLKWANIF